MEGTLSTGLKPLGAHIFSFLDLTVGLVAFFLRRMALDFDLEDVEGPDVEGPDVEGPDVQGPDVQGPDVEGPDVEGPDVEGPGLEGPGSVRVLFASSEEEEIVTLLIAALDTLVEAALDRGEVVSEPMISWTISSVGTLLMEDWDLSLSRLGVMYESSLSASLVEFSASVLIGATVDSASIFHESNKGVVY